MSVDLTGDLFANYAPARRARSRDPETSHDAARRASEFAAGQIDLVVGALRELRKAGAEQIADVVGLDAYAVRKRLPEAQRLGLAQPTEETRQTVSGRRERLWVIA